MAKATIRVCQKQEVDLSEIILEIFGNSGVNQMKLFKIQRALKRYSHDKCGGSLAYTWRDIGSALDHLVREWTIFAGMQHRLEITISLSGSLIFYDDIVFVLKSESLAPQEKKSSSLEGVPTEI